MSSDFVIKLHAIDGGRFKKVLEACSGLADVCETCDWFNPSIQDPMRGHRCHSIGYCPAATLSPKLQSYLWEKLSLGEQPSPFNSFLSSTLTEAQSNPKIGLGILLSCGIIDASGNMTEEFGGTLPAKPKEN